MAASLRHVDYVSWKVADDPTLLNDEVKSGKLFCIIVWDAQQSRNLAGLRFLVPRLREGVTLNTAMGSPFEKPDTDYPLTIWEITLGVAIELLPNCEMTDKWLFGELMEGFSKYGADPRLRIKCSSENDTNFWIVRVGGSHAPWHPFSNKNMCKFVEGKGRDEGVSLHDLVDFWQFKNAAKLKELISRNLTAQPEASYLETKYSDAADSEQACEPREQHPEQEAQTMAGVAETLDVLLTAVTELASKEAESQVITVSSPDSRSNIKHWS
jgi:hypothetical protein